MDIDAVHRFGLSLWQPFLQVLVLTLDRRPATREPLDEGRRF
jgi:hypothetical protein